MIQMKKPVCCHFTSFMSCSWHRVTNFVKPHKISTHSAHSDNYYFHFFYQLSNWVEIFWSFTKFFFEQMLKVSAFYLEKQKSFIPKKIFFWPLSISKQKNFVYWPNFQLRFWLIPWFARLSMRLSRISFVFSLY